MMRICSNVLNMTETTVADRIRSRLHVRRELPSPEQRRELRKAAGMSQQELADVIGVTPQAVSYWEAGRTPSGSFLDLYVDALRALQEGLT